MLPGKTALWVSGVILALAAPAFAQGQASFDCTAKLNKVETAICADAEIAAADRAMASSWQTLIQAADADMQTALRQDQQTFLAIRDAVFEANALNPDIQKVNLAGMMAERAALLAQISTASGDDYTGSWRNAYGLVTIAENAGQLQTRLNAADPVQGNWLCLLEGQAALPAGANADVTLASEDGPVTLSRQGAMLRVTDAPVTGYCGLNGQVGGIYFKIGG